MWGAVSWEKMPGGTDKNNPDASKQSRPTLAMVTLLDMKKNAANDKWAGQVYNAKDGKLYKSTIKLGDTPDQLEIEGCVLGFLCGGQTWTRVGPSIPSSPSNLTAKNAPKPPAGAKAAPAPVTTAKASPAPATAAKTGPAGQKAGTPAASAQTPDIGDICLLPEISKVTH